LNIQRPVPFAAETLRAAERLEAEALADRARAATQIDRNPLGVALDHLGDAVLPIYGRLDHPLLNRVVALGVFEPAIEVDVASIIDAYRLRGLRRFSVALSSIAEPPELPAWLARAGFSPRGGTAKWLRRTADGPAGGDVEVREAGPDDAAVLAEILTTAHGLPPAAEPLVGAVLGRAGWTHYLAVIDGRPVGAAALYVRDGMGWLGLGGTVVASRNRGVHRALIARRCGDAAALGCTLAVSESPGSDESGSFRNLRRARFELAGVRPTYVYEG
jgi:hypothetical protein